MTTMNYETDGRIARITLNRPERGNGITFELPYELAENVERANLIPTSMSSRCPARAKVSVAATTWSSAPSRSLTARRGFPRAHRSIRRCSSTTTIPRRCGIR